MFLEIGLTAVGLLAVAARCGDAAETNRVVRPGEIVRMTLAHDFSLREADAGVAAAAARRAQATARGYPEIVVDGSAYRYTGLGESVLGSGLIIPEVESRYVGRIGVAQPLFTGGEISSQRGSARHSEESALAGRRALTANRTLAALTAYWEWSKAYYSVRVLAAAVARMDAHARDIRNLHAAGLATDNDSLSTDVLADDTRLRLSQADRRVHAARIVLVYLTGQDLPSGAIPEKAETASRQPPESEDRLLALAATNRAERAAAEEAWRSAEALVTAAKAGGRPHVQGVAQYREARPNLLFFPPEDEWQDDAFAGVDVSWSLFDSGLTRAKVREARAQADQARLQFDETDERIRREIREARIGAVDALERLTVSERMAGSARRNLEVANSLWKEGLSRHSDVLDAHAQLTDAEFQLIAACADVALSRSALDRAAGVLRPPGGTGGSDRDEP